MKNFVYFEIVDQRTDWALNEWFFSEAEARQVAEQAKSKGEFVNPVYIRKTTCKRNAKGKVIHKIAKNMGLV